MIQAPEASLNFTRRMTWAVHYLILLLPTALSYVDSGRTLPPVFWNTTNPLFQGSSTDRVIEVNLGDTLEIVCPYYNSSSTTLQNSWEYYLIYMVEEYSYNVCIINDAKSVNLILNCSNPEQRKSFTLLIFEFQPIPGITDFQVGKNYYFISTSSGTKNSMNNQYEGACKSHQMKMVLKVQPKSTDTNKGGTNSGGGQDSVTTKPTSAPTTTTSTTTTTTSTTTTTTTTLPPSTSSTNHKTQTAKENEDLMPGSDGFPADDTVIKVRDNPNINSGIIADGGKIENSAPCLSQRGTHTFVLYTTLSLILWILMLAC